MIYSSGDEKRKIIVEILDKVLGKSDLTIELSRSNPNWDSLKQLQISIEIEDYFGVELTDAQAAEFSDVESIISLLDQISNNAS